MDANQDFCAALGAALGDPTEPEVTAGRTFFGGARRPQGVFVGLGCV
jgi:hypothetical protein